MTEARRVKNDRRRKHTKSGAKKPTAARKSVIVEEKS